MLKTFLVLLTFVLLAVVYRAGDKAGQLRAENKVVMMTEVFSCKRYAGAFVVTGAGHWLWLNVDQLPRSNIEKLETKLPKWAVAALDPTDQWKGDCPPKAST